MSRSASEDLPTPENGWPTCLSKMIDTKSYRFAATPQSAHRREICVQVQRQDRYG
jgi:hypothetical protein